MLGDAPGDARHNREIGFVFQDAALLPWRTALENVTLPLEVGGGKALPGARAPQELLDLVGLTGWERPIRMSCRAACASAWRSPAPWSRARACC